MFQVAAITNNYKNGSLQQQQQGSDPPSSVPPPPPSHSHSFVRSLHSSAAALPVRSGAVPRSQSSATAVSPIKFTMSALTTEASVPLPYRTAVASAPVPLPYRTAAVTRPPAEELDEDYDKLWKLSPPPPALMDKQHNTSREILIKCIYIFEVEEEISCVESKMPESKINEFENIFFL